MYEKTAERWAITKEQVNLLVKLLEREDGKLLLEMLELVYLPFRATLLASDNQFVINRCQGVVKFYETFIRNLDSFKADVRAEVNGEWDKQNTFNPMEAYKEIRDE